VSAASIGASALDELPVGVLADDLVARELEQVAASDLDPVPLGVVPVSSHSEQPRSPPTQCRSSP
jgi:hypothetical protein